MLEGVGLASAFFFARSLLYFDQFPLRTSNFSFIHSLKRGSFTLTPLHFSDILVLAGSSEAADSNFSVSFFSFRDSNFVLQAGVSSAACFLRHFTLAPFSLDTSLQNFSKSARQAFLDWFFEFSAKTNGLKKRMNNSNWLSNFILTPR